MSMEKDLEKLVYMRKMEKCELCHHKMKYIGLGKFVCSYCGNEKLDEYGKLREFLDENGPTPEGIVAQQTGISMNRIEQYLRHGRVEIPNGERFYIACERCGCDIRYGKFCPACAEQEAMTNGKASYQDMGEKPTHKYGSGMSGKMHFIHRRGN